MNKTLVKIISLILAVMMLVPMAVACTGEGNEGESTATTTTSGKVKNEINPEDALLALSDNKYAQAGLELTLKMIKDYYNPRTNWLKTASDNSDASAVWGVGSFIEALAEAYRISPDNKTIKDTYVDALDQLLEEYKVETTITTPNVGRHKVVYYNATRGLSGDYYYDDNAWICVQFLEAYDLLKDEKYLALAEENLKFLWTGWDDELGGGIYWDKKYQGKNTCANGPVAIAFLMAYQFTENPDYLEKGKMIYDWCNEKLLQGSLYMDSLGLDGGKNEWKAAYNQATLIYAGSQLYEITGEEEYYKHTKKVVSATVSLMFSIKGSRNDLDVSMNGNPIYKAWCIGWLARSFVKYYQIDSSKSEMGMKYLEMVLDKELTTKNAQGYYDPYFLSGGWGTESKTDVLQPSGVASTFLLAGYYDVYVKVAE